MKVSLDLAHLQTWKKGRRLVEHACRDLILYTQASGLHVSRISSVSVFQNAAIKADEILTKKYL